MLPFACDRELRVWAQPPPRDDLFVFTSEGVSDVGLGPYVEGVVRALREADIPVRPCSGHIRSTIPIGAGLSSSAALEVGIALAVTGGASVPPAVLQRAEELASGVRGGVMDQTTILGARAGHAMLLDCATGALEHVAIPPEIGFVVVDTGTRRDLADGRYAQRRAEVEAGEPRRVRHATSEQRRVYDAVDALRAGDVASLGALVSDSHASLRDDFEVSSPALDIAVKTACEHQACHGARLVGAGFAGCVLAVVEAGAEGAVADFVMQRLPGTTVFAVGAVQGASEVAAQV